MNNLNSGRRRNLSQRRRKYFNETTEENFPNLKEIAIKVLEAFGIPKRLEPEKKLPSAKNYLNTKCTDQRKDTQICKEKRQKHS